MTLTEIFRRVLTANYIHTARGSSYYMERKGSRLTLFFEKSNGVMDWKSNLDFPAAPYRDMHERWYCHRGFLAVWRDLEPILAPRILDKGIRLITVAGYSHGGAVALLCYEYCRFHRLDCVVCGYSFGSPRVLFGKASAGLSARFCGFLCIRTAGDIVARLPPCFLGYRDVGAGLVLLPQGDYGPFSSHTPEAYLSGLADYECARGPGGSRGEITR